MGVVEVKDSDGNVWNYFIDDRLRKNIDEKLRSAIGKKDEDFVLVVDGSERGGKSTLAKQVGCYVDNSLITDFSRICFTPDEFRKAIINAKPKQCVIFDEAYRGLSAKGALTEVNRVLVSLMMEMGQKNLFVIIVLPTFFLLEKYVAIWRARGLLHVWKNRKGGKGYWSYYNEKKKKLLYNHIKSKQSYSYTAIKTNFRGRFYGKYIGDEQQYRDKKRITLNKGYRTTKQEKFMEQRDKLVYLTYKELMNNLKGLADLYKLYKIPLKKSSISNIVNKMDNK